MGRSTKILVAANSPATLHRLQETLSGLEVHVAIRLRDVAKAVNSADYALLVLCLGFAEQSAIELVHSLRDARGALRMPVVAVACDERAASRETEVHVRAAGVCDFFALAAYPPDAGASARLRRRLLASLALGAGPRAEPTYVRTLHRAALLAGGIAALAKYLQVPEQRLQQWLEGKDEAPEEAFLAALELVLIELERGRGPPS